MFNTEMTAALWPIVDKRRGHITVLVFATAISHEIRQPGFKECTYAIDDDDWQRRIHTVTPSVRMCFIVVLRNLFCLGRI